MEFTFTWEKQNGLDLAHNSKIYSIAVSIVKEVISKCPGHTIEVISAETTKEKGLKIGIKYISNNEKKKLDKPFSTVVTTWELYDQTEDGKIYRQYATAGDINHAVLNNVTFDNLFKGRKTPPGVLYNVLNKLGEKPGTVYIEQSYIDDTDWSQKSISDLLSMAEVPLDDNPLLNDDYCTWRKEFDNHLNKPDLADKQPDGQLDSIYKEVIDFVGENTRHWAIECFSLACWSRRISPKDAADYIKASDKLASNTTPYIPVMAV